MKPVKIGDYIVKPSHIYFPDLKKYGPVVMIERDLRNQMKFQKFDGFTNQLDTPEEAEQVALEYGRRLIDGRTGGLEI